MPRLEELITLEEASKRYNIPIAVLTRWIESGKIKAARFNGEVLILDRSVRKALESKPAYDDKHIEALRRIIKMAQKDDELVSISRAARELGVSSASVWNWHRYGWLPQRGSGPRNAILVSRKAVKMLAHYIRQHGGKGKRIWPRIV